MSNSEHIVHSAAQVSGVTRLHPHQTVSICDVQAIRPLYWRSFTTVCRARRKHRAKVTLSHGENIWILRVVVRQLIEQDYIQQRLMYLDAAVVADKSELAKAVHKKADT